LIGHFGKQIHECTDVNNSDQDVTRKVAKGRQDLATETTPARDGDHDDGTASAWQRRGNRRELSAVSGAVSAVWSIWLLTGQQKSATEIDLAKST
jgi:ferric-dicitrate binding protein FerR (iron transport regulator)